MKNKTLIFTLLKSIIIVISLILSLILVLNIKKLDLLPFKYFLCIIMVFLLINIISCVCLFVKKIWTKIISAIIYILLLLISIVGIKYSTTTNEFLDKAFNNYKTEINTYMVLVRKKTNYKTLSDLNGVEMAYLTFDGDNEKIISEVKSQVDADLKPHDDLYDTGINFLVGQIPSLVISESSLEILSEEYDYIYDITTILYTFEVESVVKEEQKTTENNEYSHERVDKGNSLNIYVSGSDSRSKYIYSKTRSDVNMILSINPDTRKILLTSIPRDYYVQVHGQTGLKDKLTHSGIYGLNISKQTVEDLFDIDIDYSIKVGFTSVVEIVDLLGGIEIESDTEFDSYHMKGWHVEKGKNFMDGKKALAYARERYAYAGGDRHRILNQQQVLQAVLVKILQSKETLLKYDAILNSLSNLYITDIPRTKISEYVKMQLNDMSSWKFISQSVDGSGAMLPTYTAPKNKRYVMIPYEDSVEKARLQINKVLIG